MVALVYLGNYLRKITCLSCLIADKRFGHVPVQAGMGATIRRGAGEAEERFGVANRRVLRAAVGSGQEPADHELRVDEDAARARRRRLSAAAALGGHS